MVDLAKKKIDVIDLRAGMYISRIDRPWLHTDSHGREIKISRVLPVGSYGIRPMDHIIQIS